MTRHDDVTSLEPVADALEALGIEFYIGGSVASSAHGVPRATLDIDIVAAVLPEHVDRLVTMLEPAFYVDPGMVRRAIERSSAFNLIHLTTMYKIDVFVMRDRPFDAVARRRTVRRRLGEGASRLFAIASPEDTILSKLEWYRAGGEISERQWMDVIGMLRVQAGQLDLDYLRAWAGRLEVNDLLHRAETEVAARRGE